MTFHVCKMCGRGIRCEEPPKYCYFDRMDMMENISDEDAVKMGLNIDPSSAEFPGDVRFNPFTGQPVEMSFGVQLEDWQHGVMHKLWRG